MVPIEAIFERFIDPFLPDAGMVMVLGPVLLLIAIAAAAFASHLRARYKVRVPYTRKIFHFVIITTAGVVHLTWGLPAVALFGGLTSLCVLYAVYRGDGHPFYEAMARETDAPRRSLFIIAPLITTAVGGILVNLLFPHVAFVGYVVCGWGDAVGEPVGTRWGRHRYKVPSMGGVAATRSLEGSAAVASVGFAAATLALMVNGVPINTALGVGLLCGLAGALAESVSTHGLDNLTIQLAGALPAHFLISASAVSAIG